MHVDSSAISDIDYEARDRRLLVRFQSGERYGYSGVSAAVHRAFVEAESKGAFFSRRIRDRYPTTHLKS